MFADVENVSNAVFHLKNTGAAAMAAGVFLFEGSLNSTNGTDGDWFTIQACRSDSNTIETGRAASSLAASAAQAYAWELSVNAYTFVRIRCTTSVTATSIATWTIVRGSYATEPVPAIQTHAVTQSGTWNFTPATLTEYSLVSTAGTNTGVVRNASSVLYELSISNVTAAGIYVKLYKKASAPTVGTDVPFMTIKVPAGDFVEIGFGPMGKRMATGTAIAITAGPLATDTAAVGAGVQIHACYI